MVKPIQIDIFTPVRLVSTRLSEKNPQLQNIINPVIDKWKNHYKTNITNFDLQNSN